jgi:hypothetical protein
MNEIQRLRSLFLFVALTAFLDSILPAFAEPAGVWEGSYTCSQGKTLLQLVILPSKEGGNEAYFAFKTPPGADRISGCFRMQGDTVVNGAPTRFRQTEWVRRPAGYVMVDLEGLINLEVGVMAGGVHGPGCSVFWLKRIQSAPDIPDECAALTQ